MVTELVEAPTIALVTAALKRGRNGVTSSNPVATTKSRQLSAFFVLCSLFIEMYFLEMPSLRHFLA